MCLTLNIEPAATLLERQRSLTMSQLMIGLASLLIFAVWQRLLLANERKIRDEVPV
jgi:hypothetical protein